MRIPSFLLVTHHPPGFGALLLRWARSILRWLKVMRLLSVPALAVLCLGCTVPSDDVTDPLSVTSSEGTWTLVLSNAEAVMGWNDLYVYIESTDTEEATAGLILDATVTMPSMGHGSGEDVTVSELGEGDYTVEAHFQMRGAWELSGTVAATTSDEEPEAYSFAIEVVD